MAGATPPSAPVAEFWLRALSPALLILPPAVLKTVPFWVNTFAVAPMLALVMLCKAVELPKNPLPATVTIDPLPVRLFWFTPTPFAKKLELCTCSRDPFWARRPDPELFHIETRLKSPSTAPAPEPLVTMPFGHSWIRTSSNVTNTVADTFTLTPLPVKL